MKTCKYCGREANERGYTNHTGSCAGLASVIINQLQHDVLAERIVQLEGANTHCHEAMEKLAVRTVDLEAALSDATDFVDRHSETWYRSGQELLTRLRAVLSASQSTSDCGK